jgi:putative transposase
MINMQKQKCSTELYVDFLIANQNRYSGLELSRVAPAEMAHDSISRWLASSNFTPSDLWHKVEGLVNKETGYLIIDDTLLDKRYSRENELAKLQYSGDFHTLVMGIDIVTLLWTDGEIFIPVDYRIYQKENDDKTKNDHLQDMLRKAKQRGFSPFYVLMDTWYSSIENLKLISRELEWHFICNLKANRKVSISQGNYISITDLGLADRQVSKVWLKEYGFVLVCKIVDKDGDIKYLATDNLGLTDYDKFTGHFDKRWKIEEFHRGIKQTTGIEKCYSVKASSQKTHIFASFLAFIKLEMKRIKEHISWYEQKAQITRKATADYLKFSIA